MKAPSICALCASTLLLIALTIGLFPAVASGQSQLPQDDGACIDMMKAKNCVRIDARKSEDPEGMPLTYKWYLGDGTIKGGKVVDHCYSKPGKYKIVLSVIDKQTGIEQKDQAVRYVNIKTVPELVMDMPSQAKTKTLIRFNAKGSTLNGCDIKSYRWDFGDGNSKTGKSVYHQYERDGKYKVRLILYGDEKECDGCGFKMINIGEDAVELPSQQDCRPTVLLKESDLMKDSKVVLYDAITKQEQLFNLGDNINITKDKEYSLFAFNESSFTSDWSFNTKQISADSLQKLQKRLKQRLEDMPVYTLETIFYASGQYRISGKSRISMDNNLCKLSQNKHLVFELSSFTDAKADAIYNQFLSEKRAKEALNYMMGQNEEVSKRVFVARGYGESVLLNHCADKVPCSEAEHAKNRRTTLNIIGTKHDMTLKKLMEMDKEPFSSRQYYEYQKLVERYGERKKSGLHYVVQLAAFYNPNTAKFPNFSQLDGVQQQQLSDQKIVFYFGNFDTLAEAEAVRKKVSSYGIKDAFVIAYYHDKRYYIQDIGKVLD